MSDAKYKRWLIRIVAIGICAVMVALALATKQYLSDDAPKDEIGERLNAAVTMIIFVTFIAGAVLMFTRDLLNKFR